MFRGAGDARRLRVLERLLAGEMCVTDVAASTKETLTATSQRLRILRAEGISIHVESASRSIVRSRTSTFSEWCETY